MPIRRCPPRRRLVNLNGNAALLTRSTIALHLSIQLQMHQRTLSSLHNPPQASFPAYTTTSIASSTSGSFDVIYFFQPIQYLSSTPDSDK
ncbi:unnamed protein product [Sphagnum balticum]